MDKAAAEKIAYEIGQINKLLSDAVPLFRVCAVKEPDFIELSAAALLLHSFYNGIENILVIISKSRGSQEMIDAKWHRSLLEGAFAEDPRGVRIFRQDLREELGGYLLFRHFVRHSYGFQLVWNKMRPLVNGLEPVWKKVQTDLENYIRGG